MRGRTPKWIFHNLGNLLQPLEFVPESRKRQPNGKSEQFLETAFPRQGLFQPKRHSITNIALINNFLDLAHLSLQEEATLATNWIKDRPEGLKVQNLALATMTGPAMTSLPKITADVQHAINKSESLGSGEQVVLHGNPSAIAWDFSPHMAVLRRHFLPNMQFECCMILQGTLGSNFDICAASGESTAWVLLWKTVQDQLA